MSDQQTGVTPGHSAARLAAAVDRLKPLRDADPARSFVIAQLGQSLDGRIATPTGASRWINGGCALDHLHTLRANVDAVVVGVGTVIADDPQLTVRRVDGPQPARVVIDPSGRAPSAARVWEKDSVRRIIVCGHDQEVSAAAQPIRLRKQPDGRFDPHDIVAALFREGLKKLLIEGGASTVSAFVNADAVDRLHVLVAPVILGSGIAGLSLHPIDRIDAARRPRTNVHVLDDGDVLFDCDMT